MADGSKNPDISDKNYDWENNDITEICCAQILDEKVKELHVETSMESSINNIYPGMVIKCEDSKLVDGKEIND